MELAKMRSSEPEVFSTPSIDATLDYLVFGEADGKALAIPKSLVAELWVNAHEGARALARGGIEVGGLLVGPKVREGEVLVEDVVPLPTECKFGPSFQMSDSDLANLASVMQSVQDDPAKAVVGFFRSRTRGEETLRDCDFEVLNAIEQAHLSFAEDFHYCFILAPESESAAQACIAMRIGAGWREMPPLTLQPDRFSASAEQISEVTENDTAPVVEESAAEESVPEESKGGEDGPARRRAVWPYAAAAVFVLGLAGGAYHWLSIRSLQPMPIPVVSAAAKANLPHLGFSATRNGSDWKLSWDRSSVDALNPAEATLSIQDGGYQRQVPLSRAALASGILYYTPQSSDLSFSLRVGRGGADVEEHVRVLEAPPIAPKPQSGSSAAATSRSRLDKIMAAHAAAAAAAAGDTNPSANEGDARATPAGSP